ncbi:hypothetical protein ACC687_41445, partial [Rhizobium ruizarguesonis]
CRRPDPTTAPCTSKDSRNLVPLAVWLTVKRRTAKRIYALFAIVAVRENRVFINFSKYLHEISRK